jgi:hypothetical protein
VPPGNGPPATLFSVSWVAKPAVAAAPSTFLSFTITSVNDELVDRAIATPIASKRETSVPPAPAIVSAASAGTAAPL